MAAASSSAWAQATATVTDADIETARRRQPVLTERDLQRARKLNPMPSEDALRRVPIPAPLRIDQLPKPLTTAPIDLEALARGFNAATPPGTLNPPTGPAMLIFISFAIPGPTLARLVDQASRAQATLVMRGLVDGSMVGTIARVQELTAGRKVAVQIDPQAFDRYSVVRTPSFVLVGDQTLAQPCANSVCPADAYALVSGDVSLDYALAHLQRAAPRFAKDAGTYRRRLVQ